jgi:hypothetical protein
MITAALGDLTQACVYLYRNSDGTVVYVGRGASPKRALDHADGSHNADLAVLIRAGAYEVEIAGPYAGIEVACEVEAALISALSAPGKHELVNRAQGDGERFRPFGVPPEFASRRVLPPVALAELGIVTGGALIVRNSFGADLEAGRPRLDPLKPDDAVLIENLRRYWQLHPLIDCWRTDPASKPKVLLGAAGPVGHRYVPAAVQINQSALGSGDVREVPIELGAAPDLDACGLRGRLLSDVRFGRFKRDHFIWVDGAGRIRWARGIRP